MPSAFHDRRGDRAAGQPPGRSVYLAEFAFFAWAFATVFRHWQMDGDD
jgi:hypothetical protein